MGSLELFPLVLIFYYIFQRDDVKLLSTFFKKIYVAFVFLSQGSVTFEVYYWIGFLSPQEKKKMKFP